MSKKKIVRSKSKSEAVNEPEIVYENKRIQFHNSFEEQEKDNYSWLATLSPEQNLYYATQLIKRVFASELKQNKGLGNRIKFDS